MNKRRRTRKGILSDVAVVRRIDTRSGLMKGACEKEGSYHRAPYSTEYVFLREAS
jgi:hypothetical protein